MIWLCGVLAACWLAVAALDLLAVLTLRDLPPERSEAAPRRAAAVVPVRDDEAHVAAAVERLLTQRGVDLRVVAVDDRSSDGTPAILATLAARDARLQVVRVDALPPGWLGKSHALHAGASAVPQDVPWLLFADADAQMSRDTLARAIDAAERTGADHVALVPGHRGASFLGAACLLAFHLAVQRRVRGVNAEPQRGFVGTGAFALVRAAAWRRVGGHEPLRLEVVDDVLLGFLLHRAGFRTRVWLAARDLAVDWGGTPRAFLRVVEKNMFAVMRYRTWLAATVAAAVTALAGGSLAAPRLLGPCGWLVCGAYLATAVPAFPLAARLGFPCLAALLVPFARLWLVVALVRSTAVTLRQRGVRWRGTFYPLAELRAGRVRLR